MGMPFPVSDSLISLIGPSTILKELSLLDKCTLKFKEAIGGQNGFDHLLRAAQQIE
jgi:hypothetical protein